MGVTSGHFHENRWRHHDDIWLNVNCTKLHYNRSKHDAVRPHKNTIGDRPFGCTNQGRVGVFYFYIFLFVYDHKTLCRILHIFLTRNMQTSSSVVVETTPWPSIMIVATMNGISARNFTMNAMKSQCHGSELALRYRRFGQCSTFVVLHFIAIQKHCSRHSSAELNSIIRARSRSWEIKNAEIRGNAEVSRVEMPAKFEFLLYRRMFLNIERNFYVFFK